MSAKTLVALKLFLGLKRLETPAPASPRRSHQSAWSKTCQLSPGPNELGPLLGLLKRSMWQARRRAKNQPGLMYGHVRSKRPEEETEQ